MTSWRDSDDPRCPACGEKITATADYCMHCEADFADDGSIISGPDDAPTDDFSYAGGTAGGGTAGGSGGSVGTGASDDSADVSDSDDVDYGTADDAGAPPDVGQSSSPDDVGQPSPLDDTGQSMDASTIEKTSLLLRGPVCVVMGLPAGIIAFMAMLFAFGSLSGTWGGVAFLAGWIVVTAYLLRKPLASDAIGDGFYVYAGLLLVLPILTAVGMAARSVLGLSSDTVGGAIVLGITMEIFFAFPAAFFLLIGYGANYYARQKIEDALNERGRTA